jgi:NADH-quinone oxidoreductase subunit M
MMLLWLLAILVIGGVLAWLVGCLNRSWPRWVSLCALGLDLYLVMAFWVRHAPELRLAQNLSWALELNWPWIPRFGVNFHLALDGLSLLLVALSLLMGVLAVLASWTEIKEKVGFFHFNLTWILAGIIGVFLALDLFLFYFFWEMMLVPMYLLIGIWGHEKRIYASFKFFIFTQASGLFMLLSILALYFSHGNSTGNYTFNYQELLGTSFAPAAAIWVMLGFIIAFIVKLAVVPFHSWLPDAHTEAPTAGSVILAGLLLKTGGYGLLRFVLPLFPDAAEKFSPLGMLLGIIGILYGAKLAFAQTDLKRLVAYTSISHMGFVMLGVFALNKIALQGAVLQIICHGFSTGALFILVGALQERIHTRDMDLMGGLWEKVPRMGAVGMFFAMASLGLPGLGNFLGEFLVLFGAFKRNAGITVLASLGLVVSTIYALIFIQKVFHGHQKKDWRLADLNPREILAMSLMVLILVWLGLNPQPVLNTAGGPLDGIQQTLSHREIGADLDRGAKESDDAGTAGAFISNNIFSGVHDYEPGVFCSIRARHVGMKRSSKEGGDWPDYFPPLSDKGVLQ